MKKIKTIMAAFVLAGMTMVSCSSDDSGPAASIEGKWNQIKTVVKINSQSVPQKYEDNVEGCDKNYIEFVQGGVYNDVVYFKQGGECQESAADAGAWTKTEDVLEIINGGNLSGTYEIVKLSNSDLQIAAKNNDGGITTTTTVYLKKAN